MNAVALSDSTHRTHAATCIQRCRVIGRAALCLVLACSLSGCDAGVLAGMGPVGRAESNILAVSTAIMLALVVPTMVGTAYFAWWFRSDNPRARYRPDWAFSGRIELVIWSVPFLLILFLGGIAWIGSHQLDPSAPVESGSSATRPLKIQVVSLDWKWLFIYPDKDVASVNELVLPAGTPVSFTLTSSSVWNSFFVPGLGSMIYTMRGMVTHLNLISDHPGTLLGLSTQFSGDGFSDMKFKVKTVSSADFDAWVRQTKSTSTDLNAASYESLEKQGVAAPTRFANVAPHLFEAIAATKIPPGPGPDEGNPASIRPKGGS